MVSTSWPRIFISYRRKLSSAAAIGIHHRLTAAFGESAVFLDHFDFNAGDDWRRRTKPVIEGARAMLVIVDRDWLAIAKDRFADPSDPVRIELELARSASDILVIPVVIDDVSIPETPELEAFRPLGKSAFTLLRWLFSKTARRVRFDRSFVADVDDLIRTLDVHAGIDLKERAAGVATAELADVDAYTRALTEAIVRASAPTELLGSVGRADFAVAWLPRLLEGYQYKTGMRPKISEVVLKRLDDRQIARLVDDGLLESGFATTLNTNIETLRRALVEHQIPLTIRFWTTAGIPPFHGWLFGDTLLRNAWARGTGGHFHVMTPLVLFKKESAAELFETTRADIYS